MRISDWSSDVCSSDLLRRKADHPRGDDGRHPPKPGPHREPAAGVAAQRHQEGDRVAFAGWHARPDAPGFVQRRRDLLHGRGQPRLVVRALSRSEEHTSELQSLMRISYAVFCLKKKTEQTV